jgi:hypothetical protein
MNVDPEAISMTMFWVGAMFVFTPITCAGIVLGFWWFQRKKEQASEA